MPYEIGNRSFHYFFITVIGIAFTIPAFLSNFYSGDDVLIHLLWSRHFADQFWSGDFYPRWLMDMNSGLGSPAFFFYFPVPYLFTSIFHFPLLNIDPSGWLQLGLSSASALVLSGIGAYLWLGKLVDRNSAAFAAVVYMIMPYHLLVDLYMRFAFTEFWAFVWIPFVLYCSHLIVEERKMAIIAYAISYSLLIMTHLPTTLIFLPISIIYIFCLCKKSTILYIYMKIIFAFMLAIGLSAIYLIPALTTQDNILMDLMTDGKYHYSKNFLFSALNWQPSVSHDFFIYISNVSLFTFLAGMLSFYLANNYDQNLKHKVFWLSVSIFSIFMMLEVSSFIWDSFPLLQRIQFPFRINILLTIAVTALLALAIFESGKLMTTSKKSMVILLSAFFLSQTVITTVTIYERATGDWDLEKKMVIRKNLNASPEVLEYRPRWAAQSLFTFDGSIEPPSVLIDRGTAEVKLRQPRRIIVETFAEKPSFLEIRHLFYPGWYATIDGRTDSGLQVLPSHPEGLLSVFVPQGHHEVEVSLRRQPGERVGTAISAASAVIVILLFARMFITERRNHGA